MKKLVLLFAVAMAVSMTSCVCGPQENSNESGDPKDSISVVVEEANPSAPSVEEAQPSKVEDAAQPSKPIEEKKAEEATSEEPSK